MDYEKAYKDALERARNYYKGLAPCRAKDELELIFPELRESEDEMALRIIRKRMCYDPVPISDEDRRIVENWLEKQKESLHIPESCKENADSFTDDDRLRKLIIDRIRTSREMPDGLRELILTYLEKQKERKPASTEEMPYITDEHFYEREPADSFKYKLAEYMTKNCTKKESPYGYSYSINSESILQMAKDELLKRGVVQKPAEWSDYKDKVNVPYCSSEPEWGEEDEKHLNNILDAIDYWETTSGQGILLDTDINWLKSLHPQQKQEWSEEDETMINHIIEALPKWANGLITILPSQAEEYVKRLKSLRPQYHGDVTMTEAYKMGLEAGKASSWKPCEEQLNALNFAITYFMHETNYKNPTELRDLYDDLLKLK